MVKAAPKKNRGPTRRQLSELVGSTMHPLARKRGFATADLLGAWPELIGERYAGRVQPGQLIWPRRREADGEVIPAPATLVVHSDSASALMLSHEVNAIRERLNAFLGWYAISRIKIVQRALPKKTFKPVRRQRLLSKSEELEIKSKVSRVSDEKLQKALEKLGREIVSRSPHST